MIYRCHPNKARPKNMHSTQIKYGGNLIENKIELWKIMLLPHAMQLSHLSEAADRLLVPNRKSANLVWPTL